MRERAGVEREAEMKCSCGAVSSILVEYEDGTIEPKCFQCYYNPKYTKEELSMALKNIEKRAKEKRGERLKNEKAHD